LNERMRILKLLEDGKINAEEAARLLEALSNSKKEERKKKPFGLWSSLEIIPETISAALASSFKYTTSKESLQFPIKKRVEFKGISGDTEIVGQDTEIIEIKKDGFARIKEVGDTLEIKAISGDIKITVPKSTELVLKGVSGDLSIANIKGPITIASVAGDIQGKELSGSFRGEFVSGDIDLDYESLKEDIKIKSKTGDIILRLPDSVSAELEIEISRGDFGCDFELKDRSEKANIIKGIINRPVAKIQLKNEYGDVKIRKRG